MEEGGGVLVVGEVTFWGGEGVVGGDADGKGGNLRETIIT